MILNGEFDFLTPRALHETLRVGIPNSALVIIPRAYHAFTLEKGALTADLLARFADDVLAGRWQGNKAVWIAPGRTWRRAHSVSRRLRPSACHPRRRGPGMSGLLGPLDSEGRVPHGQQTRVAAFLISAHGALARQFALALPAKFEAGWQTELNAQFYREIRDRLASDARNRMGAGSRLGLYDDILGGRLASDAERRHCRSLPGKQSTSPRSRMPSTQASGQRRCYRSRQTRMTPS